jgi:hypothetical protein
LLRQHSLFVEAISVRSPLSGKELLLETSALVPVLAGARFPA